MAYQELSDVTTVKLGGVNKQTGERNPTQIEGYYVRKETRPNKFNKEKPQNLYILQTQSGEVGIYGSAGVDREMKKATLGRMTKIVSTGQVLDTGNGNPMKVFKVYQDRTNSIEVESSTPITESASLNSSYDDVDSDDEISDEIPYEAPRAPARPATVSASARSQVEALLSSSKRTKSA